jgi:hypothetical protein
MLIIELNNNDTQKDISSYIKKIVPFIEDGITEGKTSNYTWYLQQTITRRPPCKHLAVFFCDTDTDDTKAQYLKKITKLIDQKIFAGGDPDGRIWIIRDQEETMKKTKTEASSQCHFVEGKWPAVQSAGLEIQRLVLSGASKATDFLLIQYPENLSAVQIKELLEVVAQSTPEGMGTLLLPKDFDIIEISTAKLRAYRDKIDALLSIRESIEHPKGWEKKPPE